MSQTESNFKPDGLVAIRLNVCPWEILLQLFVVPECAIVRQSELFVIASTHERMVVVVFLGAALSGHACMSHHKFYAAGDANPQLVGRNGAFINPQISPGIVCDTGRVCAANLALLREH